MAMYMKNIRTNVLLVLTAIGFCLFLLLVGELACRVFCDLTFVGSSHNLFIRDAYGTSIGNAKNIKAISFGAEVYTDKHGFRIPERPNEPKDGYTEATLILGDSVGLGVGVEHGKTFAGLLQRRFPSMKIYNSSVIGYNVPDYRNIINHFLLPHKEITSVYMLFCLNDVTMEGTQEIENVLGTADTDPEIPEGVIRSVANINFVRKSNRFLRTRSKLYLMIRRLLSPDMQLLYWQAVSRFYLEENDAHFLKMAQPIVDIATTLKKEKIHFAVIILPYEFQLTSNDVSTRFPQKKIASFFEESGVYYIDAYEKFKDLNDRAEKFYLPSDPMHFSEKGHKVIYEIIMELHENLKPK